MQYNEHNDNELLYLCSENNEEATNIIIKKYKKNILGILKEYKKQYNIVGIETADLYQEALLGLLNAIHSFDKEKDVTFYTYANACIRKSIINAIKKTFEKKSRILNNSYSLDKLINNSESNFYEIFKDETNQPDRLLIDQESVDEFIKKIESKLSKSEIEIFELKLKGLKNSEISSLIDKDKKYVENTMFRINRKYKEIMNK
ncbi:MAG: sigma-70 family RNA polymerase sigma factor [Bacilli bacterium]|nr:sigma-70 family RNA polymerase sigma factor [Bacilli bacterium]